MENDRNIEETMHTHYSLNEEKSDVASKVKKRDMNFEMLRIICMLLIIASHCIVRTKLVENTTEFTINWCFLEFIRILTRFSVNAYILISGYYMVKSKFKIEKVCKIWGVTFFYAITSIFLILILGENVHIKDIIKCIMPFSSGIYWFVTTYLALYIFSPFINQLINRLDQKKFFILIATFFYMVVIAKTIFLDNNSIDPNGGSNVLWFIYLYMVGAYIRLYYNKKINKNWYIFIVLFMSLIIFLTRFFAMKFLNKEFNRLLSFTNIFNFISTISIFLYFREVKIKSIRINNLIGIISPTMFGVYLIHDNFLIRPYIYKFAMQDYSFTNTNELILRYLCTVFLIFIVCVIIEKVRKKMLTIFSNTKLFENIKNIKILKKINSIFIKINKIMES